MTDVQLIRGDLPDATLEAALAAPFVAWDIETSGLDWSNDQIGTCQIAFDHSISVVVLEGGWSPPSNLRALLESPSVRKIFHHAPFDLRFMSARWKCHPQNVACTKIASKILDPNLEGGEHSLRPVLARHLGIQINKDEQRSNWISGALSDAQLNYAATDVAYLIALHEILTSKCAASGVLDLVEASYAYLPARVALDLWGSGDVYAY